jgi:LytS/YehU family sensor histidine kinase
VELNESTVVLKTGNNIAPQRINPTVKKSGTGIENVKKRLELLYPSKHQLEIKNNKSEFVVNLSIEI